MYSGALLTASESTSGSSVHLKPASAKAGEASHWYEDRFGIIHARLNDFALDSSKGKLGCMPMAFNYCRLNENLIIECCRQG